MSDYEDSLLKQNSGSRGAWMASPNRAFVRTLINEGKIKNEKQEKFKYYEEKYRPKEV